MTDHVQEWLDLAHIPQDPPPRRPYLEPTEPTGDTEIDPYGKRADEAAATSENNWLRQSEWAQ